MEVSVLSVVSVVFFSKACWSYYCHRKGKIILQVSSLEPGNNKLSCYKKDIGLQHCELVLHLTLSEKESFTCNRNIFIMNFPSLILWYLYKVMLIHNLRAASFSSFRNLTFFKFIIVMWIWSGAVTLHGFSQRKGITLFCVHCWLVKSFLQSWLLGY